MENGERDFYFNRGADGHLTEADIEAIDLTNVSIIHFGSATGFLPGPLQSAYIRLLQKAHLSNIFISFDPNYRHLLFKNNTQSFIEQSCYFLQYCNFFKVSDEEAMLLTATDNLETAAAQLLEKTKAVFTITLGKDGTMIGMDNELTIIQTTGAGDAFVGATLYQLDQYLANSNSHLAKQDWEKIIINANKAGARTCEYLGAMEAFKHLSNSIFE
jgi:fructokinase